MTASASMGASSPCESPRRRRAARRGMALCWVLAVILLLVLVSFGLSFVTNTTHKNVARTMAAQAYADLCASALDEAGAVLRRAIREGKPMGTLDWTRALTEDWPFDRDQKGDPIDGPAIEVPATRDLAAAYFPGVEVHPVRLEAVDRGMPDTEDPLVGAIDLTVRVEGSLGGVSGGRVMHRRILFTVPCAVVRLNSPVGDYVQVNWGRPCLYLDPIGRRTVSL